METLRNANGKICGCFSFMNLLFSLQKWGISIFYGLSQRRVCLLRTILSVALSLLALCHRGVLGQMPGAEVPFLPESANFLFFLLKWKWSLFLSLMLLSRDWKSCSTSISYCDSLLWLFCYCCPAVYPRSSFSVPLLDIESYSPSFSSFVKM